MRSLQYLLFSQMFSADELVSIGKNKDNPSDFAMHVDQRFGEFEFPDEFIFDIWGALNDAKNGRL